MMTEDEQLKSPLPTAYIIAQVHPRTGQRRYLTRDLEWTDSPSEAWLHNSREGAEDQANWYNLIPEGTPGYVPSQVLAYQPKRGEHCQGEVDRWLHYREYCKRRTLSKP